MKRKTHHVRKFCLTGIIERKKSCFSWPIEDLKKKKSKRYKKKKTCNIKILGFGFFIISLAAQVMY